MARIGLSLCAALALGGCASLGREPGHAHRFAGEPTRDEQRLLAGRPLRLGIALSGGGLRASYYSMGALRALYEKRILDEADVISAVSGGGYTAYWVYTGQAAVDRGGAPTRFGSARFDDPVFARSLCEQVGNANFVGLPAMIGYGLVGQARALYERRIGEVFGADDPGMTVGQLKPRVEGGYPHLIVNATVLKPKPAGWREGLYEITAAGTNWGGRAKPEASWDEAPAVRYRVAVAASGAAVARLLSRKVDEPPGSPRRKVALYDGGGSENLGAIALIRRGVPTIVVIDAEHDPKYDFPAYRNLKRRLQAWGGDVTIPGIESFLVVRSGRESPPKSYFRGESTLVDARGRTVSSTIHYVKMSMPADFRERLKEQWQETIDAEKEHPQVADFRARMRANFANGEYDCSVHEGQPVPDRSFFEYSVHRYGNWWNRTRRARLSSGFFAMNFPQYTTADQSMYLDQAPAFIGLGYLQALDMIESAGFSQSR